MGQVLQFPAIKKHGPAPLSPKQAEVVADQIVTSYQQRLRLHRKNMKRLWRQFWQLVIFLLVMGLILK